MTEPPRRLIAICTFRAVNQMVLDDLAALIAEAEAKAKAAQIADAARTKPPAETPTVRALVGLLGGRASGWF